MSSELLYKRILIIFLELSKVPLDERELLEKKKSVPHLQLSKEFEKVYIQKNNQL